MNSNHLDVPKRLAFLVLNDTHRDSRVLRMADSARSSGYQVRVFAINSSRYPAGVEVRASGAEVFRQMIVPKVVWEVIGAGRRRSREKPASRPAEHGPIQDSRRGRVPLHRIRGVIAAGTVAVAASAKRRLRDRFDRATTANVIEWKPDLVHAHDANTLNIALQVRQGRGVPFVYDAHELWEERGSLVRGTKEDSDDKQLLDRATGVAAGLVTVSPSVAGWMKERYDLPELPVLVRNVPPASAAPDRSTGKLRGLAGLDANAKIIVYVGILGPNRGLVETVEALALLEDDVHLVMLGYSDDAYDQTLASISDSAGVADRLHFVGSVAPNDVSPTIADADLSLVIIQAEYLNDAFSLPNKLFESIHGGLPVLASSLPDISEMVNEYGIGKVIESPTAGEIASATRLLLGDTHLFRAACAAASTELTWENEVSRLFAVYDRILSVPAE